MAQNLLRQCTQKSQPFILEQRDTDLLFRGSPNQRIIYLHGEPPSDDIPGTVALEPLR